MSGLGDRRTRVRIQQMTEASDSYGQLQPDPWSTVATVWCLKRALTGREATNAQQTKATVAFVLETWHPRSLVDVTPAMRCVVDGKPYGISWVDDVDGRHETLRIYCTQPVLPPETA